MTELRSYVYIDRLQPQLAAHLGANARGYIPVPGCAAMLVEIAPGVLINQVLDVAVKAANIRPGLMEVERHYGVLEFHAQNQADVQLAGQAALQVLGRSEKDRFKPQILSSQIIRKVNPYHAQMVNVSRLCSMLLPGQDLYILELQPAAYIAVAANEAEKSAQITLVDCQLYGAVGRLSIGGRQADIQRAAAAAQTAIAQIDGIEN